MIKKRIISFIVAVTMLLPVFPNYTRNVVKAATIVDSTPQVTINGKQYDVILDNRRIENGNEVYDARIKIPDYSYTSSLPATDFMGILILGSIDIDSSLKGYNDSNNVNVAYNGNSYSGNLSRVVDLATDDSKYVDTKSDMLYKAGYYNGTSYNYTAQESKSFAVASYIYNKSLLDVSAGTPVTTTIPAEDMNSRLDLGSSVVETTPSGTTANGIQLYKLSNKTVSGSTDLTKAFLFPTDGEYEETPEDMHDTGGADPTVINKPTTDTFSMLSLAPFSPPSSFNGTTLPGTFPNTEAWEWRVLPRDSSIDKNHTIKIGGNYFLTASDTSLNDVKVDTTADSINDTWCDVSTDIFLCSAGSKDDAQAIADKLPNTITRNMYAFGRDGGIQYTIGNNTYDTISGSPMDKSDIDKVYSNLQIKDPTLASLLKIEPLGAVDFSRSDVDSQVRWIDGKTEQPVVGSPDGVAKTQSGYYLRMHGEYHYGSCKITNNIHGTVNVKQYNNAIYYVGTVSRPLNNYNLSVNYIDEDTNQPITGSPISSCETSNVYSETDLTSTSNSDGTNSLGAYYLPSAAPTGYTLDTSQYASSTKGYSVGFNEPSDLLPHNGWSSNNIADLQVYCKATAQRGTVVKRYFVDGIERNEDEEKITDVPVGSHTYSSDKSYSGYTCSTPSVTVNVEANKIAYCDFEFTSIPVVEKGTVIKRYFLKGVEQTADEKKIDGVETGSHTYSVDRTYPRYTCENTSVTVNVTANSITYCDFNYGFENHPPTVHLYAPSTVVMGDNLEVNASGTDPDGDPLRYDWDTPSDFKGSTMNDTASGYFDSIGNKTFSVTVTDPYNASDYDSTVVKVVPPVPNVVIDKSGTEKENRKVTLDAEKYSSSGSKGRYSLDWSKAKWQFFDSNGSELAVDNNPTSSTIVKSLQSTTGSKSIDFIFKKAGKYTAKCTLYNTAGYSNSFSVDLNITLDLAPTAKFYFPDGDTGYRDGKDLSPNGLAQGTDTLVDSSKSSDGDNIGKRMWIACFDSDNDGSFVNITNNEDGTKKAVPEKELWYVYDLDYNGDSDTRYKVQVPDSTPLNGKLVTIGSDGHKYAYVNDSLNPHWRYVGSYDDVKKLDINKINCGNLASVTFKSTSCGHFYYGEIVQESFGQETIPELITDKDKKQANTFEF